VTGLTYVEAMEEIIKFLSKLPALMKKDQVERMVEMLIIAKAQERNILIVGAGRSGLVGRAFAMRLMHLGFKTYVLGDTIVPAIGRGDIVVAISGSGTTASVVLAAEAAKKVGAKVIAITSHPDSPLGKIADHIVLVPGRTKVAKEADYFTRQILGVHEPLTPLGTLFEVAALVFLDSVIVELMKRLEVTEEEMRARHANIE